MASGNSPTYQRLVKKLAKTTDENLLAVEASIDALLGNTSERRDDPISHDTRWIVKRMQDVGATKIVSVDFDGVLYQTKDIGSSWDPLLIDQKPVHGAINWLKSIVQEADFLVVIHSSRLTDKLNLHGAVQNAIHGWLKKCGVTDDLLDKICYSGDKIPADLYIDDNGYRFTGDNFPSPEEIRRIHSWLWLKDKKK